ncbi:MAG: heavy metal translocating P-type ATPase [Deltaproteobacteria bacterium]|nr:heavy metal translocating P-type ATPase [Deltaproteobacteria bacterium]
MIENHDNRHGQSRGAGSGKKDGGHQGHGGGGQSHHAMMAADFKRRFFVSTILTVPILAIAPLIQDVFGYTFAFAGDSYVQFALATVVYFYGGRPFLGGMAGELKKAQPGMMTLIALAITVAWGYSSLVVFGLPGKVFFWELSTLVDVMLLGHWIEMRSVMGASGALEALARLMPSTAHRVTQGGDTEDVPVADLEKGDRVLVKPGEKVPTDGTVIQGRSSVNEAMVTGESKPVEKGEGDEVIGGSVNGESSFVMEVKKTGDETYLSQVMDMVKKAQESKSRTQDLANRAAVWLTFIALGAGGITLAVWLLAGREFAFSLERMVTVMVITCPHALGLAVPLVVAVSTAMAASRGLLIRDRASFERARKVQAVVFDKTGTLTEGRFSVDEVAAMDGWDEDRVLAAAASLEKNSEHPIAKGIVEKAGEKGLELQEPRDFSAIPGKGAKARVGESEVFVVSPGYLDEQGVKSPKDRIKQMAKGGRTVVVVLEKGERPVGLISLSDVIRPESYEAVERLQSMGIRVMMLTGDSREVAAEVAEKLNLSDYFAEVLPAQKADKIKEVKKRGLLVAMVGDGVNDAPALAESDLGVAIGAGTEVAVQTADVILVRNDPRDVVGIVQLADATYSKIVQNLWWATGYNAVAIPLAAGALYNWGFLLPPAAGALVMTISTVIVAANARLLQRKGKKARVGKGKRKTTVG